MDKIFTDTNIVSFLIICITALAGFNAWIVKWVLHKNYKRESTLINMINTILSTIDHRMKTIEAGNKMQKKEHLDIMIPKLEKIEKKLEI